MGNHLSQKPKFIFILSFLPSCEGNFQILSSFCYTVLCIYLLVSDIQSDKPSVIGCSVMSLYPSFPSAFSKEVLFRYQCSRNHFDLFVFRNSFG